MAKKSKQRSHMERRAVITGDEHDAFTRWRHLLCYLEKPGAKAYVKTKANRRARHEAKREIRSGLSSIG